MGAGAGELWDGRLRRHRAQWDTVPNGIPCPMGLRPPQSNFRERDLRVGSAINPRCASPRQKTNVALGWLVEVASFRRNESETRGKGVTLCPSLTLRVLIARWKRPGYDFKTIAPASVDGQISDE